MVNERKSVRSPMPASRRRCELKVGSAVLPATILDYSEDGFAVLFAAIRRRRKAAFNCTPSRAGLTAAWPT